MELLAVITAISIFPRRCKVIIYTDSANVIAKQISYKKLLNVNHKIKQKNFILWEIFFEIKNFLNLNITFTKGPNIGNFFVHNKTIKWAICSLPWTMVLALPIP